MNTSLREQLLLLPELLGAHVLLSVLSLFTCCALAIPGSLLLLPHARVRAAVLAAASALQTIPSLALLSLMVPVLGMFGFWPAFAALTLYGILPILRNTTSGLLSVDALTVEAARAVGMTERQVLLRVQLPLALPLVLAGVRTAAMWVIGIATLSTPVGQASLGNYLFGGLATRNWWAVGVGCAAAATLALCLDGVLATAQTGLDPLLRLDAPQRRRRLWRQALHAALLGLGLVGGVLVAQPGQEAQTIARAGAAPTSSPRAALPLSAEGALVVGAKGFTEQYILAALLTKRLAASGFEVERRESLGSTVVFDALVAGDIDVYVEYTGTLWTNHMDRQSGSPAWVVRGATGAWLAERHGVRQLGALGFENAYAIAVRARTAEALGLETVEDLSRSAAGLSLGSDYEFFQRPEWRSVKTAYNLSFKALKTYDPTFMYTALERGDVDAITAFSSDGRIAALNLAVLADPEQALPPYEAVILLSRRAAALPTVADALSVLVGRIDVRLMRAANLRVDGPPPADTPDEAAAWLERALAGGSK